MLAGCGGEDPTASIRQARPFVQTPNCVPGLMPLKREGMADALPDNDCPDPVPGSGPCTSPRRTPSWASVPRTLARRHPSPRSQPTPGTRTLGTPSLAAPAGGWPYPGSGGTKRATITLESPKQEHPHQRPKPSAWCGQRTSQVESRRLQRSASQGSKKAA